MRDTAYKKIRIEFTGPVPAGLPSLDGISSFTSEGQEASFLFAGNINRIIGLAASSELRNISIEEPDLEEIFLHYYNRADQTAASQAVE